MKRDEERRRHDDLTCPDMLHIVLDGNVVTRQKGKKNVN